MSEDFSEDNLPILEAMGDTMKCGVFTNTNGQILIVHDKEIEGALQWVEYDASFNTLSLIHIGGKVQDLGLEIKQQMQENIANSDQVTLAYMEGQQIKTVQQAILVVKDY